MSSSWDGTQLREALTAAAGWLERHRAQVDALNVFPVPDGDTGTNMSLTLSGALADVPPDPSCAVVAEGVQRSTMMRGRGNSGIILSQVFRGIAQALAGHHRIGGAELAAALAQASATAYKAVLKPVEGTMLTVLREASEAARAALHRPAAGEAEGAEKAGGAPSVADHSSEFSVHAVARESAASIREVLEAATRAAREAVARTPELLKTLRDAGVVDAGGQGLLLVFEGMLRYARGEHDATHAHAHHAAAPARATHTGFGYCTSFVVRGAQLRLDELRATFEPLGDSLVLAGDEQAARVHLHTSRPGDALNAALAYGALDAVEIANMDLQHAAIGGQPAPVGQEHAPNAANTLSAEDAPRTGVVAVASGPGFAAIFRSLHAGEVVLGGPGANPSTRELLAAIERLPQQEIVLLPNDPNGVLAAHQAAQLCGRRAEVLPTRTMAHGVAALLSLNYAAGLEDTLATMRAAAHHVRAAEVTRAVRDATVDGVPARAGQYIGMVDGTLAAAAESRDALLDALDERMALHNADIVSIYYGGELERDEAERLAGRLAARHPELSVETHEGGQPLYDMIIAAE